MRTGPIGFNLAPVRRFGDTFFDPIFHGLNARRFCLFHCCPRFLISLSHIRARESSELSHSPSHRNRHNLNADKYAKKEGCHVVKKPRSKCNCDVAHLILQVLCFCGAFITNPRNARIRVMLVTYAANH
jgi:hypothetical protein